MAFENILVEVRGGIETITFNRPQALNALNSDLLDEFSECLDVYIPMMIFGHLCLLGSMLMLFFSLIYHIEIWITFWP